MEDVYRGLRLRESILENEVIANLNITNRYSMQKKPEASKAMSTTFGDIQQSKTTKRRHLKHE